MTVDANRVSDELADFEAVLEAAPNVDPYEGRRMLLLAGAKLREALRRPPSLSGGEVEPVAWFYEHWVAGEHWTGPQLTDKEPKMDGATRNIRPLYASPAPDIIAAKDAELSRVKKERSDYVRQCVDLGGIVRHNVARAEAAEARANAAVEALRPFARIAEAEDCAGTPSGRSIIVNVDLCRSALSTLNGAKP